MCLLQDSEFLPLPVHVPLLLSFIRAEKIQCRRPLLHSLRVHVCGFTVPMGLWQKKGEHCVLVPSQQGFSLPSAHSLEQIQITL